jgi:D-apionolactonase
MRHGSNAHPGGGVRREVAAGPLRALFDGADLRYLRVGDAEWVRRIYVGVRDERWGTVEPRVSDVRVEQRAGNEFEATFVAEHVRGPVDFEWRGRIHGRAERGGYREWAITVTYEMDGRARRTYETCRTGVCVLHPPSGVAGMACTIEHTSGARKEGRFPSFDIAPHQPFTDIRAMKHSVAGHTVRIEFSGEVFETEDQRNWADGSFKTYCRPLSEPAPYRLVAGERVSHRVTVRMSVQEGWISPASRAWLRIEETALDPLPEMGLRRNGGSTFGERELARLAALQLGYLRVDVDLSDREWKEGLRGAAEVARRVRVPLEVAVHVGESDEPLRALGKEVEQFGARVCRWIVYEAGRHMASERGVARAKAVLAEFAPGVPVGGGTIGNFAELNRNRPAAGSMDLLAYPVSPQVHATDDVSIIENLEGIRATVIAAWLIAGRLGPTGLAVGPVVLHRQADPFAKGKDGSGAEIDTVVSEPRQLTAFGAAWTVGALKQLAESCAGSVTLFDVSGPTGVMSGNGVYPLYRVLAELAGFAGSEVLLCTQQEPLKHAGLAVRKGRRVRLLAASLHWEETRVELKEPARLRRVAFSPVVAGVDGRAGQLVAVQEGPGELVLPPYAVVRVDYIDGGAEDQA